MSGALTAEWLSSESATLAGGAESELERLVAISSPSGDVAGAEAMCAAVSELLPAGAKVERPECSTPAHAPDLLATVRGSGSGRLLLLGHLDTVVAHRDHRSLQARGDRLVGSGAVDMKGGVVLAVGVMRALARRPQAFAEVSLLAVNDEEWRTGGFSHAPRFLDYDACLCFEAGELDDRGVDAVIARRKAAATLRVLAHGRAAHSGASPERGRSALLALAEIARRVAALNGPSGAARMTAVPTVLRSGDAFNVVPAAGELVCDLRADSLDAFEAALAAVPTELDEVRLEAQLVRQWPGMDTRELVCERLLASARERLGRELVAGERGGASDASHLAEQLPLTVDGLGPRGGLAHNPGEFVLRDSIRPRGEVALALAAAALERSSV